MVATGLSNPPRRFAVGLAVLGSLGSLVACGPASKGSILVSSVKLDRSTLNFEVGDSASKLAAIILPINATNTRVTWSSSNPQVASVNDQGLVSPIAPGTATISVTTEDGAKTATCAVTVTIAKIVTELALDRTTLEMLANDDAVKLMAMATPSQSNQELIWLSSDESVATVDASGYVTPVAAGSAVIIVKTTEGSKAARCAVTVLAPPVAVTGVTLDKTTINGTVDSLVVLVATVLPTDAADKAVFWSSSDINVATVDEHGVVTCQAEGSATITVKTNDGHYTAASQLTVTKPAHPVTSVTLDFHKIDLTVGGFAGKLVATVAPEDADNQNVLWSSSDETVATVSNTGMVTAQAAGTANITVTTSDGKFTDTCTVIVHSDVVAAGDTYLLVGVQSGRCVENEISSANLQLWDCNSELQQRFRFEDRGDDYYALVNLGQEKCVDVVWESTYDGANIIVYTCETALNQQWSIEQLGNSGVLLRARHSQKLLEAPNEETENGTNIQQWEASGTDNQKFQLNWVDENSLANGWYFYNGIP